MSDLSIVKVASISHAMSTHRTMFIKPSMSHNHTLSTCGDKGPIILYLHVITVVLLVIFAQIVSKFVLKNLGIKLIPLEKMNQALKNKSKN
jgi:hypothetical protein